MQNRTSWMMGALVVGATLTAFGYGFNGYRNTPAPVVSAGKRPANTPQDSDPMAPRLFDSSGTIRIHIVGAVKKPGVYTLPTWARVIDAVKKSGGATANANLDAINLADKLRDAEQLRVPMKGHAEVLTSHQPTPEPPVIPSGAGGHRTGRYPFIPVPTLPPVQVAVPAAHGSGHSRTSSKLVPGVDPPVNLNAAGREQLVRLPEVGPGTADKIIAYREANGRFGSPEDLLNVKGIGPKRFERLRPLITAP